MFRTLPLVALLLVASLVGAQETKTLYSQTSPAVVYLRHEFSLNPAKAQSPDVWKRFETLVRNPVLGRYFAISSGSGFLVDDQGRLITNRHVVEVGRVEALRRRILTRIGKLLDEIPTAQFSAADKTALKADFERVLDKSSYRFAAFQGATFLGTVQIVKVGNDETDLAAAEITGYHGAFLELAPAEATSDRLVGTDVASLGYPLGETLDSMFEERVVTMNKGSVSAFRSTQALDVQHSAAISHGNSGGPLVDNLGRVIGVNTAGLDQSVASSLFYAISTKRVREFLKGVGLESWILWNERLRSVAVHPEQAGRLTLTTDPAEVEVTADGRRLGATPLDTPLAAGSYSLKFRRSGWAFTEQSVVIEASKTLELSPKGLPAFALRPTPRSENPVSLEFRNVDHVYQFHSLDQIEVPQGEYQLTIQGIPGLEKASIPITMGAGPLDLDLSPFLARESLEIRGFQPQARVWLDGKLLEAGTPLPISLTAGVHKIGVWGPELSPLEPLDLTIRPGVKPFVTWEPQARWPGEPFAWGGWSLLGAGALGLATGLVLNQDSVILPSVKNYKEYTAKKSESSSIIAFSLITTLTGAALEWWAQGVLQEELRIKKVFGL